VWPWLLRCEHFGSFFDLHADEVAEFDQFGLLRFERGKTVEGIVERQQLVVGNGAGDLQFIHIQMWRAGPAPLSIACGGRGQLESGASLRQPRRKSARDFARIERANPPA